MEIDEDAFKYALEAATRALNEDSKEGREAMMTLTFHEMAMGDDQNRASIGRIMKELYPGFLEWYKNEVQRETTGIAVSTALVNFASVMIVHLSVYLVKPGHSPEKLIEYFCDNIRKSAYAKYAASLRADTLLRPVPPVSR